MSTGPGPSRDPEDIRRTRERHRALFSDAQLLNPCPLVGFDRPLQTLSPELGQAMRRLASIAGAEGSALVETDWRSLLDATLGLGENEAILIEAGSRLSRGDWARHG